MKRTFDSVISQPLAAPEETWATLPGDLVRLLAGADPSLLPSLFVLSKHFHLSLALAPPMSPLWRDYCSTLIGLSDHVPDVAKGTTWKDIVLASPDLPRIYYAKCARARFACGAMRPDFRFSICPVPGCTLPIAKHSIVDWVEEKVKLRGHPLQMTDREVRPSSARPFVFGASCFLSRVRRFIYNEARQSIELWYCQSFGPGMYLHDEAAVSPAMLDPRLAWRVDKFLGIV